MGKLSESMSNNNIEYNMKVLKKCLFKDDVYDIRRNNEVMEMLDSVFSKVATYVFNSQYLGDGGFNTKGYGKDVREALTNKSADIGALAVTAERPSTPTSVGEYVLGEDWH